MSSGGNWVNCGFTTMGSKSNSMGYENSTLLSKMSEGEDSSDSDEEDDRREFGNSKDEEVDDPEELAKSKDERSTCAYVSETRDDVPVNGKSRDEVVDDRL